MTRPVLELVLDSVAQHDLDFILGLDAEIAQLRRRRDAHSAKAIERILRNAPVEPGQHTVLLDSSVSGSGVIYHLVIDGRRIV